jgi:hypothetical protein
MTLEEVIVAGQPAFIQMTGGLDFIVSRRLIRIILIGFTGAFLTSAATSD